MVISICKSKFSIFGFLTFFTLASTTVTAQDVSMHIEQIAPGTTIEFEDIDGARSFQSFQGRAGDGWIETYPDGTGFDVQYISDADGNMLRIEVDGQIYRTYVPHNCRRVVGECYYTEVTGTDKQRFRRTVTPTDDGFIMVSEGIDKNGNLFPIVRSTVIIDDLGLVLWAHRDFPDGSTYRYWRVGYLPTS